jgi:protein PhnA
MAPESRQKEFAAERDGQIGSKEAMAFSQCLTACGNAEMTMTTIAKDANGAQLKDGDSVTLIKDLKVKGSSVVLKRGALIKNIRLTDNPAEIECRAEKIKDLVLRTEFVKKA